MTPLYHQKKIINDAFIKKDSSSFFSSKPTNISSNSAQPIIHSENKDLSISLSQPFIQKIRSIYEKIEGYKRVFEKEIRYFASFLDTKRKKVPHGSYKKIAPSLPPSLPPPPSLPLSPSSIPSLPPSLSSCILPFLSPYFLHLVLIIFSPPSTFLSFLALIKDFTFLSSYLHQISSFSASSPVKYL